MKGRGRRTAWAVAGFLVAHALLAATAVSTKAPAFDEGIYVLAGLGAWSAGDHRVCETPSPWTLWHTLPHLVDPPELPAGPRWERMVEPKGGPHAQWDWTVNTLYRTPGIDGLALIRRSRRMMVVAPLLLLALIAFWTRRLGGPLAAVVATGALALDPLLLGHGAIVKEDVPMALLLVALAWSAWRTGLRATWGRVAALGVLSGLCLCTKHSGVVALPLVGLLLGLRAVLPERWGGGPWELPWGRADGLRGRLLAVLTLSVCAGLIAWGVLWAGYGFRPGPTPDPAVHLPLRAAEPGPFLSASQAGLLPEHWAWGADELARRSERPAFFLGEISRQGWWSYFPVALLVKTPLATLLLLLLGLWTAPKAARARRTQPPEVRWGLVCLLAPAALYAGAAVASRMNIGLRHVLPPYVMLFPCLGLLAAAAVERWGRKARIGVAALGVLLLAEVGSAWPNYIAFFHRGAGGPEGGIRWLSDSNLDWGQDLNALAAWRREHPRGTLYLCYFGTTDPAAYGLDYVNLPGGYGWGPPPRAPREAGVIAISATNFQGQYLSEEERRFYDGLRGRRPLTVLGGTIYVFPWGPQSQE